jgi:carboxyl-terminal processing protease
MNKQLFWNTLFFTFTLGMTFTAGYITNDFVERRTDEYPLLHEAIDILESNALNPLPEQNVLEYGMIRGVVQAYNDPYTIFLEPPQHELQTNQLEGTFGGIGVKIERGEGEILLYPFPDGPAFEAGVRNGDKLVSVDGVIITPEMTNDVIDAMIRGLVGKNVVLVVLRLTEGEEHTFMIKRREVALPSVIYYPVAGEPRIGILQVSVMADTTPDEILRAVEALEANGTHYFILDLRENGGGLLNAGVETARLFLEAGIVIEQQYRGEQVERFSAHDPGSLADIPLVVLVDHQTASAAEIVAGALQINNRAVLVGEPTYGKDTIQLVFELQDGSSLHVTAAHWWFPELDFPVDGVGVKPNYGDGMSEGDWMRMAIDLLLQNP